MGLWWCHSIASNDTSTDSRAGFVVLSTTGGYSSNKTAWGTISELDEDTAKLQIFASIVYEAIANEVEKVDRISN